MRSSKSFVYIILLIIAIIFIATNATPLINILIEGDFIIGYKKTESVSYNYDIKTVKGTTEYLSIRQGPGKNYNEIGKLYNGETVNVISLSNDGNWAKIIYNGVECWVSTNYIE